MAVMQGCHEHAGTRLGLAGSRIPDHAPQREASRILGGEVLDGTMTESRLPEPLNLYDI